MDPSQQQGWEIKNATIEVVQSDVCAIQSKVWGIRRWYMVVQSIKDGSLRVELVIVAIP